MRYKSSKLLLLLLLSLLLLLLSLLLLCARNVNARGQAQCKGKSLKTV